MINNVRANAMFHSSNHNLPGESYVLYGTLTLTLTVTGRFVEEVKEMVEKFDMWIQEEHLKIAHAKTEFILISSHKHIKKRECSRGIPQRTSLASEIFGSHW